MKPQYVPVLAGLIAILLLPACGIETTAPLEPAQEVQDNAAQQDGEAQTSKDLAEAPAEEQVTAAIEDLESPICPVSGIDLRDAGIGATATYEGKLYGFSCPHCKASFLANPGDYLTKAEATNQEAAGPAPDGNEADESAEPQETGDLADTNNT